MTDGLMTDNGKNEIENGNDDNENFEPKQMLENFSD